MKVDRTNQILKGKNTNIKWCGIVYKSNYIKYSGVTIHVIDLFDPITDYGREVYRIHIPENSKFVVCEEII